eukprot:Nk52_evm38s248 gene=Nk52_evmTU38s248
MTANNPGLEGEESMQKHGHGNRSNSTGGSETFPLAGCVPTSETGVDHFVSSNAQYDGRGVIVAVFDSGVDPGAPGLQITTEGKPKIIDLVDGTGSGDVDTSTVVTAKDGCIKGLTGRTLKIPEGWVNPSGKYRIGMKSGFSVFSGNLKKRMKEERRKEWDVKQRQAVTKAQAAYTELFEKCKEPTAEEAIELKELKNRIGELSKYDKSYEDLGPVYDCIVFHDGSEWKAAVDISEEGDLSKAKLMSDYKVNQEYGTFSDIDRLNFGLKIYNEGNTLSIVTDGSCHGTHVAGIVGAYFPNDTGLNGVAPGCQIISVRIGDMRVDSLETGTGLIRGLKVAIESNCDLINMSYGEASSLCNSGEFMRLASEAINTHGIIYLSSAGNAGPALSSVGAPGGTTNDIISVGAHVTPAAMEVEYSLRSKLPAMQFTFTSCGPAMDGDYGVDISAPGCAITSMPNWTLKSISRKNGTSMASPNACGSFAVLLSGLKMKNIPYSPHSIRRAVENTCKAIPEEDKTTIGHGVIQIDKAYDRAVVLSKAIERDVRFDISIPQHGRGIYLREPFSTKIVTVATVNVTPTFHEDTDNQIKIDFEMRLKLKCAAEWVSLAENFMVMHETRTFEVRVDPTALKPGLHLTEILAFNSSDMSSGPVFRVPITVIKPHKSEDRQCSSYIFEDVSFKPGHKERFFLEVPEKATWVDVKIKGLDMDSKRIYAVHTLQLVDTARYSDYEKRTYVHLSKGECVDKSQTVYPGVLMELAIEQYWSSLGSGRISIEIEFRGVFCQNKEITMLGGEQFTRIDIQSPFAKETVLPTGKLTHIQQFVRPSTTKMVPIDVERDLLSKGRQVYEMHVSYSLSLTETHDVTLVSPYLNDSLYESEFHSQLFAIFDKNSRRVGVSDFRPSPTKLEKGSYTIVLMLRHHDMSLLETMKAWPLVVYLKLKTAISLSVHSSAPQAVCNRGQFKEKVLRAGDGCPVYLKVADSGKVPKSAKIGDILTGSLTFGKQSPEGGRRTCRPAGHPLRFIVCAHANTTDPTPKTKEKSESHPVDEVVSDKVRDAKVCLLKSLMKDCEREAYDSFYEGLKEEYPDYLHLQYAHLVALDEGKARLDDLEDIIDVCDNVVSLISHDELALFFGTKVDEEDRDALKEKEKMMKIKNILTDTLTRKCKAIIDDMKSTKTSEKIEEYKQTFKVLAKWCEVSDTKVALLKVVYEQLNERYGIALNFYRNHVKVHDKNSWTIKKELYEKLEWDHLVSLEENALILKFMDSPSMYV